MAWLLRHPVHPELYWGFPEGGGICTWVSDHRRAVRYGRKFTPNIAGATMVPDFLQLMEQGIERHKARCKEDGA